VSSAVQTRIRAVLKGTEFLQADIDGLADEADLYAAGLNSHATVNLMLALEDAFDVELPDRLLRRRT
jgi:acyl carrier protein